MFSPGETNWQSKGGRFEGKVMTYFKLCCKEVTLFFFKEWETKLLSKWRILMQCFNCVVLNSSDSF